MCCTESQEAHMTMKATPPMIELPSHGYVRLRQIAQALPCSRSTILRMVRNGNFPRPIYLSRRVRVWRAETVRAWLNDREREAEAA
jgi:prophage regulatory protein